MSTTKLTLAQAKRQLKIQTKNVENLDIISDSQKETINKLTKDNDQFTMELVTAFEQMEQKDNQISSLEKQVKTIVERLNNTDNELDDFYADVKYYKEQLRFYKQIIIHTTKL